MQKEHTLDVFSRKHRNKWQFPSLSMSFAKTLRDEEQTVQGSGVVVYRVTQGIALGYEQAVLS